jgi:hypothetical protein
MAKVNTTEYHLSNVVGFEFKPEIGFCRARDGVTVNVASATDLKVGSVLGKVTATGKYVPRNPAASNGSEVAAAVVIENISVAAATDTQVNVYVNGPLELKEAGLVFDVAHDAGQKATAISEIKAFAGVVKVN